MIKLIKPDKFYPNMKSEIVILFSSEKSEVTLEEYYNPHFIYILIFGKEQINLVHLI